MERLFAALARRPALFAGAAALLASLNTLPNQPVLDDGWVIFDNPLVKSLRQLPRIFTEAYNVGGAPTNAGLYRPVTTLTYALNHALHGDLPGGYHAVNLLLHLAVTLLVVALARRVVAAEAPARAGLAAALSGLLFAVHPAHVEAVAGLVGRAELLAAAGALGALLLAATRAEGRWRLPAAALAAALGVLSKENAAVAPLLVLLLALAAPAAAGLPARPGLSRGPARAALAAALGVALVLLAGVALALLPRPGGLGGVPAQAAWFGAQPRGVVAATMSRCLADYLRLLVFPHPLGVDFFYAQRFPFTRPWAPEALGAAAVWGTALVGAAASLRRAPAVALGVLWVFAALLPVTNLLAPSGVLMAERLLYLPSAGACLALGAALAWAGERLAGRPRAAAAFAGAVCLALVALAGRTVARNAEWRDGRTLWEAEVRKAPLDPVVNNNLATALTQAGEPARAKERLAVALKTAPYYWRAWVNLGIAEQRLRNLEAAARAFQQAIALAPGASSPQLFLGLLLEERGDLAGAEQALARAVQLSPEDARLRAQRGTLLARLGRREEAREELRRAAELDPRSAEVRRRREEVEAGGGR